MTIRDDYVARLESEVDELRERCKLLEEIAGARFEAPPLFGFSKNEATIFGLLLKNKLARREAIMRLIYGYHDQDEAQVKIIDVWGCKMGAKVKDYGIAIEPVWGQGYTMPDESKRIAADLLERANA